MRSEIEAKKIEFSNNSIKITASFGVCSVRPVQASKIEGIIEAADKNFYLKK